MTIYWDKWGELYLSIEKAVSKRCCCDDCRGDYTKIDRADLGEFMKGLALTLEANTSSKVDIDLNLTHGDPDSPNITDFVCNSSPWLRQCVGFETEYFDVNCRGKGWDRCTKCNYIFNILELDIATSENNKVVKLCKACIGVIKAQGEANLRAESPVECCKCHTTVLVKINSAEVSKTWVCDKCRGLNNSEKQ